MKTFQIAEQGLCKDCREPVLAEAGEEVRCTGCQETYNKAARKEVVRAYRYRLYPDPKRQKEIEEQIELARLIYNRLLEKANNEYQTTGSLKINRSTFDHLLKEAVSENKEFDRLYSQTRQNIYARLQWAYQSFFRRVKEKRAGKKVSVGFPRFRAKGRYASITYPQPSGFGIEKERESTTLRVGKIGRIKVKLHRPIEGVIKTLTIKKEAGEYYAIFSALNEVEPQKFDDQNPVGIDMGLRTFATLSDGRKIPKPNFAREKEKRIAHWQRVIERRQKDSHRRDKAKLKLERELQRINNQTNDFIQKTTTELINAGYTSFAFEDLHIENMLKNHKLSRSINNATWGRFIRVLSYKAEEAGLRVNMVDARNTSQTCSNCGFLHQLALSDRVFYCKHCGYRKDRDINAARNILNRATAGHAESNARGDLVSTLSVRNGHAEPGKREHTPYAISTMSDAEEAHTFKEGEDVTRTLRCQHNKGHRFLVHNSYKF